MWANIDTGFILKICIFAIKWNQFLIIGDQKEDCLVTVQTYMSAYQESIPNIQ